MRRLGGSGVEGVEERRKFSGKGRIVLVTLVKTEKVKVKKAEVGPCFSQRAFSLRSLQSQSC